MTDSYKTYYPQLDGLRSFAVLGVLFFHIYDIRPDHEPLLKIVYDKLAIARDIPIYFFFIISGYLITRLLILNASRITYKIFYSSRFLRILPLYYFVLIGIYLIIPLFWDLPFTPFKEQLWFWIPASNTAMAFHQKVTGPEHFWTLCVEIQFYLLIPFLIFNFSRRSLFIILSIAWALSFLSKAVFNHFGWDAFYSSLCRMDIVIAGIMAALWTYPLYKKKYQMIFSGILLLFILLYFIFPNDSAHLAIRLSLISLFCLVILQILINTSGFLVAFLRSGIFKHTANWSYSIYVFHPFCIYYYYHHYGQHNYFFDFTISVLLSVLAGIAGYYLVERPFHILRKKIFTFNTENQTP